MDHHPSHRHDPAAAVFGPRAHTRRAQLRNLHAIDHGG